MGCFFLKLVYPPRIKVKTCPYDSGLVKAEVLGRFEEGLDFSSFQDKVICLIVNFGCPASEKLNPENSPPPRVKPGWGGEIWASGVERAVLMLN